MSAVSSPWLLMVSGTAGVTPCYDVQHLVMGVSSPLAARGWESAKHPGYTCGCPSLAALGVYLDLVPWDGVLALLPAALVLGSLLLHVGQLPQVVAASTRNRQRQG